MKAASGTLADVLVRIVERRRQVVGAQVMPVEPTEPTGGREILTAADNAFLAALAGRRGRAVIAEVKLGSPRLGRLDVDPLRQARTYADHGAAALSVVVEPDFFHGSYDLLARCRQASGLPAIAKDFVVDPVQLTWARDAGADAVLLIAALYDRRELVRLAAQARALGLVPLIETHDPGDLDKLTGESWELVGVNNRDLRTFAIDLERSISMLPSLPAAALKVAESGIDGRPALERLRESGFDAFLIGESLLLAPDPAAKLAELLG